MGPFLTMLTGFTCLALGGEVLVRSSVGLAKRLGLSELIIGLTVVAFATSSPELAVSISAAYFGYADVALGNVVGSNIFNILFVLGLSALAAPLLVDRQLLYRDVPIMIALSVFTYAIAQNGVIEHYEGIVLLALFLGYIVLLIATARQSHQVATERAVHSSSPPLGRENSPPAALPSRSSIGCFLRKLLILAALLIGVCVGVGVLMLGAKLFVDGAVSVARAWEVSELVIAVTLVAAGTSLPEAATSIVAGFRGRRDIAIGNVVGSNIFNILCVLGIGTLITRDGMHVAGEALMSDLPIMVGVAIICLPIFFTGKTVGRFEGLLLFGYYLAYTANLALAGTHSPYLSVFRQSMLWGIIPLTVIVLVVRVLRQIFSGRRS
ncbi:MAG: calcium/sodium antiporter [Thermogutta sp.]